MLRSGMEVLAELTEHLEDRGFVLIRSVLSQPEVHELSAALDAAVLGESARTRAGSRYGARNLLTLVPAIRALAQAPELRALVEPVLGESALPVRGLLFDKTPTANWHLGWHQDRVIPVRARTDLPGYGPWSTKGGVPHVLPPAKILESMLAVRLHLDHAGPENGALRVLPGSHRGGIFTSEEIERWVREMQPVCCAARRGDILLMRPLLLHASGISEHPRHRRVVHLEYAGAPLPAPLEWPVIVGLSAARS